MLYDVIFLMTAIGKISIQFVYYECTIFPFPNDRYGINRNNKDKSVIRKPKTPTEYHWEGYGVGY